MKKSTLKKVLKGYLLLSFAMGLLQIIAYLPIIKRIRQTGRNDDMITSKSGAKYIKMKNNMFMKFLGYKFAAVINIGGWLFILTDNEFDHLSDNCKDVTIAHEIGHIEHMHLSNTIESLKSIIGRIFGVESAVAKEYEADQYAFDTYGYEKTIDALTEMSTKVKGISKKEILRRIDHIKLIYLEEENQEYKKSVEILYNNIKYYEKRIDHMCKLRAGTGLILCED